jgi:hypothetical protein
MAWFKVNALKLMKKKKGSNKSVFFCLSLKVGGYKVVVNHGYKHKAREYMTGTTAILTF